MQSLSILFFLLSDFMFGSQEPLNMTTTDLGKKKKETNIKVKAKKIYFSDIFKLRH